MCLATPSRRPCSLDGGGTAGAADTIDIRLAAVVAVIVIAFSGYSFLTRGPARP